MSQLELHSISVAGFSADARFEGTRIVVRLAGNADLRIGSQLHTLLARLHDEACRAKVSEVRIDFRGLEFMNSSCFKTFVTWLLRLQETPKAQQYRVRFQADPDKHWQRGSLSALSYFAVELVSVEI